MSKEDRIKEAQREKFVIAVVAVVSTFLLMMAAFMVVTEDRIEIKELTVLSNENNTLEVNMVWKANHNSPFILFFEKPSPCMQLVDNDLTRAVIKNRMNSDVLTYSTIECSEEEKEELYLAIQIDTGLDVTIQDLAIYDNVLYENLKKNPYCP